MRIAAWLVLLTLSASAASQSRAQADRLDVILRRGTIIDGTGLPRFRADVGIADGRIAAIGDLSKRRAATEIDVTGLDVAPGFINIHSHPSIDAMPRAENMLTQGVTTEILNADGGGALDLAAQMARVSAAGLAVNVGGYIGFNVVWSDVMGPADRRATSDDIARMRELIVAGLKAGAWGVSAGLDYKPAYFATTEEVIAVLSAASGWRTNFTNHDRITPESNFSSKAGIAETLRIAAETGLLGVVTHMKAQGHEQGSGAQLVDMIRQATRSGRAAAADAYPYVAGQTALGALIIPAWAQDGGRQEMLKRFADPAARTRIAAEAEQVLKARFGGPEGVYLPATQKELTAVMSELEVPAGEAIIRLLEQGNPGAILRFGSEADVRTILQYPDTSIACDCGATTSTATHPRNYGTYPRVLGHYVRETGVLTWEDAIRKMTAVPAATIGMIDRGLLVPGMAADVTVFDPMTVTDRATYEKPAVLSEGIRYVFVNGTLSLRDGTVTGAQGGRVLFRAAHMPSRLTSTSAYSRVTLKGTVESWQVDLKLQQSDGRRTARGSFRMKDPSSGASIELKSPGVLQVAKGWASFTGRARFQPGNEEQSIAVTLEQPDPSQPGSSAMLTVEPDRSDRIRGRLVTTRLEFRTNH